MIDLAAIAIILGAVVLGLVEGGKLHSVRFITLIAGMVCAKLLAPSLSTHLESTFQVLRENPDSPYVAYFVILGVSIVFAHLLILLAMPLLKNKNPKGSKRILGGLVGIMSGAAMVMVSFLFLQTVVPEEDAFWAKMKMSRTAKCSTWFLEKSNPFSPHGLENVNILPGTGGNSTINCLKGPLALPAKEEPPAEAAGETPQTRETD